MISKTSVMFGTKLKMLMVERGLTYSQLEKLTGISDSSLHRYAEGQVEIPLKSAKTIASHFNKTVDEMIYEREYS